MLLNIDIKSHISRIFHQSIILNLLKRLPFVIVSCMCPTPKLTQEKIYKTSLDHNSKNVRKLCVNTNFKMNCTVS